MPLSSQKATICWIDTERQGGFMPTLPFHFGSNRSAHSFGASAGLTRVLFQMIASRAYCSVKSLFSALMSGGKFGSSGGVHSAIQPAFMPVVDALVGEGDEHVGEVSAGGELGLEALDQGIAAEPDLLRLDLRDRLRGISRAAARCRWAAGCCRRRAGLPSSPPRRPRSRIGRSRPAPRKQGLPPQPPRGRASGRHGSRIAEPWFFLPEFFLHFGKRLRGSSGAVNS